MPYPREISSVVTNYEAEVQRYTSQKLLREFGHAMPKIQHKPGEIVNDQRITAVAE